MKLEASKPKQPPKVKFAIDQVILVLLVPWEIGSTDTTWTPFYSDLLVKREVENKTKTDRLMVGKTNGSFFLNFFEKDIFSGKNSK